MKTKEGVGRVCRAKGDVSGERKRKEGEDAKCSCGRVKTTQRLLTKKMISKKEESEHGENRGCFYSGADRVICKLYDIKQKQMTDAALRLMDRHNVAVEKKNSPFAGSLPASTLCF